jgi:hypothetical protein
MISFKKSQAQLMLDNGLIDVKGVFSANFWGRLTAILLGKPRIPLYVAFPKIYDIGSKYH